MSLLDSRFAFDTDVFNSRAYRAAAMSSMTHALIRRIRASSNNGNTSDPASSNDSVSITSSGVADDGDTIIAPPDNTTETDVIIMVKREISVRRETIVDTKSRAQTAAVTGLRIMHEAPRHQIIAPSKFGMRQARKSWGWLSSIAESDMWPTRRFPGNLSPSPVATDTNIKILLLGTSEAGKSTAINVVRLLSQMPAKLPQIRNFRVLHAALKFVDYQLELYLKAEKHRLQSLPVTLGTEHAQKLLGVLSEHSRSVAQRLRLLHTQPLIQAQDTIYCMREEINYVCEHLLECNIEISRPKSQPNNQNIVVDKELKSLLDSVNSMIKPDHTNSPDPDLGHEECYYTRTTGVASTDYFDGATSATFYDVGGTSSERKKWIQVFEGTTKVFYFLDVGCYDQTSIEDGITNRLYEESAF
ncbi:G-protein alpha subunit-domain-containing protein [Aspergillus crustosus]